MYPRPFEPLLVTLAFIVALAQHLVQHEPGLKLVIDWDFAQQQLAALLPKRDCLKSQRDLLNAQSYVEAGEPGAALHHLRQVIGRLRQFAAKQGN